MSNNVGVTVTLKAISEILSERGIDERGKVQQCIDNEVMRRMEPYMPFDTGMMAHSMITATSVGSGEVKVNTVYAHRRLLQARTNGLRGPNYFERMKADCRDDILRGAVQSAGGEISK